MKRCFEVMLLAGLFFLNIFIGVAKISGIQNKCHASDLSIVKTTEGNIIRTDYADSSGKLTVASDKQYVISNSLGGWIGYLAAAGLTGENRGNLHHGKA